MPIPPIYFVSGFKMHITNLHTCKQTINRVTVQGGIIYGLEKLASMNLKIDVYSILVQPKHLHPSPQQTY